MGITWRPAMWSDIDPGLSIPHASAHLPLMENCLLAGWKDIFHNPFFISALLESGPPIKGHQVVGIGLAVLVATAFADAEIRSPRPDIASRIVASAHSNQSALLTRADVARANAGDGVDVLIFHCAWCDDILDPIQR